MYAPLRSLTDISDLEEPPAYELPREAEPKAVLVQRALDWVIESIRTFSSSSYGTYHFDSLVLPCRFFVCC